MTQEEYSAVCPYLGLQDDADSHATFATEAHRCFRLTNPTKIAAPHQEAYCLGAEHVTCPVYLGEGLPRGQQPPAAAPLPPSAPPPPPSGPTVRGPKRGEAAPTRSRPRDAAGGPARPARRPTDPGSLGPRPRGGGVSVPVATIGLFALAVVVIALAFAIQQLVGDSGDDTISPSDAVATRNALNQTRTAQAGTGSDTTPTQPATGQTPGTTTPGTGSPTAAPGTPAPTGTSGGTTYIVQSGDSCFSIAEANGVELQAFLDANGLTEADCANLNIDDEVIIPN